MRQLDLHFKKRHSADVVIEAEGKLAFGDSSVVALFGASGAGKSTLLRWIAGLSKADEGHLNFKSGAEDSVWCDQARDIHISPQDRRIGYVSQGSSLFPHLTTKQNIAFGLRSLSIDERNARVDRLLATFDLKNLASQLPATLSGGQKQRVALARALAIQPKLILLDEPFSSLDYPTRERLFPLVREWLQGFSVPTLLVTHDPREAEALHAPLVAFSGHRLDL